MGIIQPHASTQGVVFLENDVVNTHAPLHTMIGRTVAFDLIHTERGPAAVNVRISKRLLVRPGNLMGALAAPLMVALTTYLGIYQLRWPHFHSYIVSINFVSFLFVVVLSRIPFSYRLRPADVTLIGLAISGGAAGSFVASLLVPTRLRADSARFLLVALIIVHAFAAQRLDPRILSSQSWKPIVANTLPLR
jgi:hypothetical protein